MNPQRNTGRAARMALTVAGLSALSTNHAAVAAGMTEEQALRVHSRAYRATYSRGESMNLVQLNQYATKRRRARQTHPGKRSKP